MLPNSRIIPPNNSKQPLNSAAGLYESKRGFIDSIRTNSSVIPPASKPKYESVLGMAERYEQWNSQKPKKETIEIQQSISTDSKKSTKGFGKLFWKKQQKTVDGTLNDDLPKVRPANVVKTHTNIPLAPPPTATRMRTISQPTVTQFTNVPEEYIIKQQPPRLPCKKRSSHSLLASFEEATSMSDASNRKSTGSYSIYSTFGGEESIYSIEDPKSAISLTNSISSVSESIDSFNTGASAIDDDDSTDDEINDVIEEVINENGLIITSSPVGDDNESDDDDDAFVDATDFSQDDIEKEEEKYKTLSKRLSGGHFGSAGGLVLSISQTSSPNTKRSSYRKSRPPPDDIAKSMLNWKRYSDSSRKKSITQAIPLDLPESRPSSQITVVDLKSVTENAVAKEENKEAEENENTVKDLNQDNVEKKRTNVLKEKINDEKNNIDKNDEEKIQKEKKEEEELSEPDKLALRQEAEKLLSGFSDTSAKEIPTFSFSSDFSKSLDDVWNTDSLDMVTVKDPRDVGIKISIDLVSDDEEVKNTATLLWKEDESVVERSKMAEWLGQGKPFRSAVLKSYMNYFEFSGMRLESAFRKLCSKLYFKAEAQQIDRILESFAHRYWDCNSNCIFRNVDTVYAVVYSLLLLNTDLHVAQGNHPRMTRSQFIDNTMSTIQDQYKKGQSVNKAWETEVEAYLKDMYISVKQYQILQPLSGKPALTKRASLLGNKRVVGLKRRVNSIISKSGRESVLILDNQSRISISNNGPLSPPLKSPSRNSFSSVSSGTSFSSRLGSPTSLNSPMSNSMMQYMNTQDTSLFSSQPPYFKEGVVLRKHLLESASQKAKHREWKECFLEVGSHGELRMYSLQNNPNEDRRTGFRHSNLYLDLSDRSNRQQNSLSFGGVVENGKWGAHSQLIGSLNLNHTLSNPLPPPGYNRQRPHVFAIQQSDGGVYLFQTASADQLREWVSTCNYWAGRKSKEPLPGGVSNMEYGWGDCLADVVMNLDAHYSGKYSGSSFTKDPDSVFINNWIPPSATMVSSTMNEKEQHIQLQKHLNNLNSEINHHRDVKGKMLIKFPGKCNNYFKAMANWEVRSKYLLHEIIKYQNYCDALEKSIKQQEKVKEEEDVNCRLVYKENDVDLFKEINQELRLNF